MKFCRTILKTTLAAAFLLASPAHAGFGDIFEALEPAQLLEKLQKQIAKQSISTKLDIVDTEIYQGINIGLKYQIESEPSYVDGYYTRIDKYKLTNDVNTGDVLEDNDTPIGFNIRQNAEITFARQFKSQGQSITARPYTLKNIPLTAEKALRNLNVGDFIAMEGNLNLILSLSSTTALTGGMDFGASTNVYVSGEFLIHIFKMTDNKVRVKLIATRGKGAGLGLNITSDKFEYFGFKLVDRRIDSWINLKPLKASVNNGKGELFMVDYVFDLTNPQAAAAYENIMTRKARFKDMIVINPVDSPSEIKSKILTDMTAVEKIAWEDRQLDPKLRRVDRIFKGSNSSVGQYVNTRMGLVFAKFETDSSYSQNKVIYSDRNNVENKYILDNFTQSTEAKFLWGFYGDETTIATNMLFTSNDSWLPVKFIALTMSRDIKMKNVSERDYKGIQKHVAQIIPASEYARIDWKKWDFSKGNLVNGFFKNEIVFHPEALSALPFMPIDQLAESFGRYVDKTGRPLKYTQVIARGKAPEPDNEKNFRADIKLIAKSMFVAFSTHYPTEVRYQAFKDLKSYGMWQERGAGYLLSLLPRASLSSLISYQMVFSAKGAEAVTYKFGNMQNEELYKSLIYIQKIVTDRSFDLRLYTNGDGEFTTKKD